MNRLWSLLIITFIAIIALVGCGTNNATDKRENIAEELDPGNRNQNPDQNNKLGYVRYTKDQIQTDAENKNSVTIDRTKLANMITRIILQNDEIIEVATLVTDEEVLIAFSKNADIDSNTAADIAKKSAVSVMPERFEVYVSENETLMQDIQRLHNSSIQGKNYDNTINRIKNEMKKSPQGMDKS
ncbi:YhcN/YlaJ family sporulation lipoprotein [Virgibacillus doumboii]|uniref:YhcN/YlaJ family sporulation lipoprotein n=1 Tax=Virgibacillus doumboii TaxID=2697503 RepID=UPI0013DF02E7|nr:YhcN/YlaJ family sporulation lipoprotein [Virgibacillus doumboii]